MIVEEDFLTEQELSIIEERVIDTPYFPWFYNPISTSEDYPFYSHVLIARDKLGIKSYWYDFFYPIFQRFIEKHEIFQGEYETLRGALNDSLSFKDKCGDPHVDYAEEHKVIILYLTDSSGDTVFYNKQWKDGDKTIFKNSKDCPKLSIEQRITPKKGKIICYNGLHYHSAEWKKENERRVICMFAFKGKNINNDLL